ncbi:MAG: hypothetical protein MUC36_11410 [Planctomycetes bacterium]|jgi:DNA-directed RNA polymerase specialized sigma24 family protein|nr:hypothetical protein [Planctomycetota bacterium]
MAILAARVGPGWLVGRSGAGVGPVWALTGPARWQTLQAASSDLDGHRSGRLEQAMQENGESNEWPGLRSALELRCADLASPERVADAIQEALLALVIARAAGVVIRDEVGWCLVIVRRRVVDGHRRRRREVAGVEMESVPAVEAAEVDWGRALREAGIEVTDEACELLARMASGYRGNHSLAECLGRDVKTIRERRARLLGLLRRAYVKLFGVPPPMNDPWVQPGIVMVAASSALETTSERGLPC